MVYSGKFSSGPTNKGEHWTLGTLQNAILGRSHRSKPCMQKLEYLQSLIRDFLSIPDDFYIGFSPASSTGAMEMALWNLIGQRGVNIISYDVFGEIWRKDITEQMKIQTSKVIEAPFGSAPTLEELETLDFSNDTVFVSTATTTSTSINDFSWIKQDREGLVFVDASASLFTEKYDWSRFDVVIGPFQKTLGAEAGLGIIILSQRAYERLKTYTPSWPIPRLFRLKNNGKVIDGFFNGETINTPSMLLIEDAIKSLEYFTKSGGIDYVIRLTDDNYSTVKTFLNGSKFYDFICQDENQRSRVNTCLRPRRNNNWEAILKLTEYLETYGVHDIAGHKLAMPSIRLWHGPTINKADLLHTLELLENSFEKVMKY